MAIWEHIRNSTPYRLYANGSSEGSLSNHGSGIPEIIFWVEILNFKKIYDRLYANGTDCIKRTWNTPLSIIWYS